MNLNGLEGQSHVAKILRKLLPYLLYDFIKCVFVALTTKGSFYSQNNEDQELLEYFPEQYGHYLDIGSGNPKYLSNTYYFYRKGWDGYLIDPIKSNVLASGIFRPRDKVLRNFVGTHNKKQTFFQMEPSYFSTADPLVVRHWISKGAQLVAKYEIRTIRIQDLPFECSPSDPVFFSIDTEGSELNVLKGINFTRQLPRAIILETWNSGEVSNVEDCNSILRENGYYKISNSAENDIWIHKDYSKSIKQIE